MNHWRAWVGLAFLALAVALVALVRWVEAPETPPVASVVSESSLVDKQPESAMTATKGKPVSTSASHLGSNPGSFLLTDEEVAALSPAEQEQYLRMLESLQDIQQQVEVLEQEQSQLEQRVNRRSEENAALHSELDAMREVIEKPEVTVTDLPDGAPGQAH